MTYGKALSRSLAALLMFFAFASDAAAAAGKLVDAIKNEDKAAIRDLLRNRTEVSSHEPDGTTPLHWAAYMDDVETVEALLKAGVGATAKNRFGVTPLSLAAINGNGRLMEILLKAGADPNAALPEGETVLMTAARTGKVDGLRVLLAHGADINAKEEGRGQTALMWAAAEGNAEAVRLLIEAGADMHARSTVGFMPLHFAARDGRMDAARILVKAGADLEAMTREYVTQCWICGGGEGIKRDAPKEIVGPNAIFLAAMNSHFDLATMLLDAGANPNALPEGYSVLHRLTTVRKTGRDYVRPDKVGSGKMTSLEFARTLVKHGADANIKAVKGISGAGGTPFLAAALTRDAEYMRVLVELRANPNVANRAGMTPLLAAAGVGTNTAGASPGTEADQIEAIKLALELGNDINAKDNNGNTAMHGAALKEAPSVVKFLSENGAKVEVWNAQNKDGWTPLLIAQGIRRANNFHFHEATRSAIVEALKGTEPAPAKDVWEGKHPGFE
jgi:uncharacterized protein